MGGGQGEKISLEKQCLTKSYLETKLKRECKKSVLTQAVSKLSPLDIVRKKKVSIHVKII